MKEELQKYKEQLSAQKELISLVSDPDMEIGIKEIEDTWDILLKGKIVYNNIMTYAFSLVRNAHNKNM